MGGKRLLVSAVVCMCVLAAPSFAKDLAVVVHKGNAVRNLPLADLSKICKSVTRKWPDGRDIVVILKDPTSPEMRLALHKIYGMPPEEVKALIVSANQVKRERPPFLLVNSDEALVKAVETTPGSIGLVDVYSITGGITVLKVDGKTPLEPGYVLHGNQ
jgi:ABC-type phosphate transport system substrate-binding protein